MSFDPDAYLKATAPGAVAPAPVPAGGFDPDEYLRATEPKAAPAAASAVDSFDPDAYLKATEPKGPAAAPAFDPDAYLKATEPTSSGVGDFLKRTGKAALEGTGDALMGVGRAAQHVIDKADRAFGLPTDDEIAAKAGRDRAGNVYQGVPAAVNAAKAAAGFVTSLPDEYTKGSLAIDPKRDSGKAAVAANMVGSLAPAVLSGAAAPVVMAGQIGEGERKNAIAQGESEELANARFDLGFSVGLPVAALGPVARKSAGLVQRVVTKAVTGAAAGAIGSAALDLAQGRDVNAKSAALNAGVLGGMGGFMGLKGETPAARAARDVAPATNTAADINHEANIAEIAKASGLPIDKVRADYFEERGQSAPNAVKPAEAAPAATAAEAPVAAKEANPFDQFDPKPAAEIPGGASAQALVQKYPEQLSSMPPNHIPVEIQAADGSVYPAVMNGFYDDAGKLVSVGRLTDNGWSHGLPKPGEKILTPLPSPAEWDSGIREGTTAGEAHPELAPLPEGAAAEYLGRKHLIMEGVGEPMDQWQVKLPGEERGRTMTTEQLQAEGFQAPEVPATKGGAGGGASRFDKILEQHFKREAMAGHGQDLIDKAHAAGQTTHGVVDDFFSKAWDKMPSGQRQQFGDWVARSVGIARAPEFLTTDTLREYFTPGRILKGGYSEGDKVVGFNEQKDGRWSVEIKGADGRLRTHSTEPTAKQVKSALGADKYAETQGTEDKNWQAENFDWPKELKERLGSNDISNLEGTDRGVVAMMLDGLRKFDRAGADASGPARGALAGASLASEAGSIDPRVMLAFGRAAAGGVAGFMTGDTKEEKARNAIIGAGLAMGAPWMANFLRKTGAGQKLFTYIAEEKKNFWQKTDPLVLLPSRIITPSGGENFRALVRSAYGEGSAAAKAIAGQGMAVGKDLGQAINAAVATAAGRDALKGQVHQFLTGDAQVKAQVGPQLPIKVYAQASRARYLIDALSDDLIARGVVAGDMAQTILSNKGQYLRRSYEAFSNPSFEYDPKKVQAAIDAVHNEMIWKSQTGGGAAPGALPTRAEAESLVAALMDKHAPDKVADFMTGQGKIGGKDISVLMRRQDLLPEIRSLLGETMDPTFNIPETMSRMGRLLEADRTQKNIAAMGQRFGLFKTVRDLQFSREISTSERQSNFNGLYAEPHIADAFNRIASSGKVDGLGAYMGELVSKDGALAKLIGVPTYAVKYASTALNPISWAPNLLHGLWANVANGNFRFDNAGRALMLGAEESGILRKFFPDNPSRIALQNELKFLNKEGVFGQNPVAAELADILQRDFYSKLGSGPIKVLKLFSAFDKYSDHFNKYIAFKSEQARYGGALPNATPEEITRMAVQRVTDTLPTYSKIPELIKGLSRAAALQQFVSFPYELSRNTSNTYNYGQEDIRNGIRTGNQALVRVGAERIALQTAVLAAGSALGVSALSKLWASVSDNQDRSLRVLLPPWLKSAELVYRGPIKDGKASYANLSYLLAYSEAVAPLNDAMRELQAGGDGTQALDKMLDTLKERFTGSSMFLPAAIGAVTGVDLDSKRQIPSSDVTPTAKDRAAYFWNKVRPGIVRWSDQTAQAIHAQEGKYGQAFDLSSQLSKLVGVRTQVSDIPKLIDYRVRDLSDQIENASRIYKTSLSRNLPVEQMQKQYELSEAARLKVFNNLRQVYEAGRALGTPEERIVEAFEKAKADPRDILAVLDGRYRPQDYGEKPSAWNLMAKIRELPAANQAIEIAKVYAQDPGMGRTLEAIYKKDARGITGRDGVIARLGVNNGERAAYLRDKLISLQTPAERQALLVDLARKGLVSPLVIQQMTQRQPAARN